MTPIILETTPKKSEKEKEEREERKKNWHTRLIVSSTLESFWMRKTQKRQNGAIFCRRVLANQLDLFIYLFLS